MILLQIPKTQINKRREAIHHYTRQFGWIPLKSSDIPFSNITKIPPIDVIEILNHNCDRMNTNHDLPAIEINKLRVLYVICMFSDKTESQCGYLDDEFPLFLLASHQLLPPPPCSFSSLHSLATQFLSVIALILGLFCTSIIPIRLPYIATMLVCIANDFSMARFVILTRFISR